MADGALPELLARFHAARLLVVGDVMLDRFVYGIAERISPEAPIPVLKVGQESAMPGGAANVARNAASLGAHVVLVGVIGEDDAAQALKSALAEIPTIDSQLIPDRSRPTTLKQRFVAGRQQILRADREVTAPLSEWTAELVLARCREVLGTCDVVVLSDYAKGALSDTVISELISTARSAGKQVIVDPKSRSFLRYQGATVLTPNRQELALATDEDCGTDASLVAAAQTILQQQLCEAMVVTRGASGMTVLAAGTEAAHLPGRAREVFDVSGAGDTAVAALALGLAGGGDLISAARLANIAAGLVVAKSGTATVTAGEIAAALAHFESGSDSTKFFTLEHAVQQAQSWHRQGLSVAFANGCFDLLHTGHLSLLEKARRAADRLIVGLNSDLSVRRLKGEGRPVQGEIARATILSSLKSVDAVVIFADDTPMALIEALLPDVLVKGSDYTIDTVIGAEFVQRRGGRVLLVELVPDQSTSSTLARATAARAT